MSLRWAACAASSRLFTILGSSEEGRQNIPKPPCQKVFNPQLNIVANGAIVVTARLPLHSQKVFLLSYVRIQNLICRPPRLNLWVGRTGPSGRKKAVFPLPPEGVLCLGETAHNCPLFLWASEWLFRLKKIFCKIKGDVFMPYWHSEDCRGLVPGALKAPPPIHRFYHLNISLSTGVQKMEPLQWMWAICICQVDITLSPCYCIHVIVTLSEASN